ncbi:MAG: CDP-diacylglycerol--serine O-phosphatidyltransferase [Edaphobacter sp.]|uniref:CDP-diacylglycerol--serine O-phosphatidyltransferase n=1 Tax=Edaphobacter sp. TaxID=1934404 RepID=UPI0023866A90|nr:CDP-diacylglycerol--serine O-phosphatidyltransferase [Edaphobacter sp.]MDE1177556.1 CDP-diacylglycerol--serine O-phosphatidyltransferase [Edaphobacter sp.]
MESTASGTARPLSKERRRPSRGMYVLPSLFTAANIAAGYYAITQAMQGTALEPQYFDRAALAIGFAVLFDGVDGMIARLTNTASDFGKELDSLADVITFGVAPSLLAYLWGFKSLPIANFLMLREKVLHLGIFVCFLYLICGASRLARFNISVNPQPRNPGRPGKKYFVGMPIPAGAGVIASVVHFENGSPIFDPRLSIVWLCLILFTGFLMVSTWRFWSGKEISLGQRHPFQLVALIVAIGAVIALYSEYALIVVALGYLVSGVLARLAYSWGQKRRRQATGVS